MLSVLMPRRSAGTLSPFDDRWYDQLGYGWFGRKTEAGPTVNETTALSYSAVWAATRVIAGTMARHPFMLYRELDRGREELPKDPRVRMLRFSPNPYWRANTLRSVMSHWQMNHGNAIAEIQRDGSGNPIALWPIHPSRIRLMRDPDSGESYLNVSNKGAPPTPLMYDDVLHIPNWLTTTVEDFDIPWGVGVYQMARENIGTGLAAEKARAKGFGRNATPIVVVETPKKMVREDRDAFRREWSEIHEEGGSSVALATDGATVKPLNANLRDMQHLELSYFTIEDMSRWYGVPVHMLSHLLKSSQNNMEQLGKEFVQLCLMIYAEPWQQEAHAKLLTDSERGDHCWQYDFTMLQLGDMAAQQSFFSSMLTLGVNTRNEVRELMGYNPMEGGDTPLVQGAMVAVNEEGEPESPEPPEVPEPEDTEEDPPEDMQDQQASVKEAWIRSVAVRMAKVEETAWKRAADDAGKFLPKMDEFFAKHTDRLSEALAECCPEASEMLSSKWIECSRDAMNRLADSETPATLAAAVGRYCDVLIASTPDAVVRRWKESR